MTAHTTPALDSILLIDGVIDLPNEQLLSGPDGQPYTAVGVRDGRIAAWGHRTDVETWPAASVHDLGGYLTPGLIDAHSHAISAIHNTNGCDLTGVHSPDQLVEALTGYTATLPADAWVYGWGLDTSGIPLDRHVLDRIIPDRPCLVRLFDGHGAVASSRALEVAGVDGPRSLPARSEVVCDAEGVPTGMLQEFPAMDLVDRARPALDDTEYATALLASLGEMARTGLTRVNLLDDWHTPEPILTEAERIGDLPVAVQVSPVCLADTDEVGWQRIADRQGARGRNWVVSGVKFFLDGTIDNGTAWLDPADLLGQSRRSVWSDPAEYQAAVAFFHERGIYTATHAIGDRAVAWAIETHAALPPREGLRHRVEHIETLDPELIPAFVATGLIASMQPTHSTHFLAAEGSDTWTSRLGLERAHREGFPYRSLLDAGALLAIGSDWPVAPYDPRETIAAAVLRRNPHTPEADPTFPAQRLEPAQALTAHSRGGAIALQLGDTVGELTVGMEATFTIFGSQPLETPATQLSQIPVRATVLAGRVVG